MLVYFSRILVIRSHFSTKICAKSKPLQTSIRIDHGLSCSSLIREFGQTPNLKMGRWCKWKKSQFESRNFLKSIQRLRLSCLRALLWRCTESWSRNLQNLSNRPLLFIALSVLAVNTGGLVFMLALSYVPTIIAAILIYGLLICAGIASAMRDYQGPAS